MKQQKPFFEAEGFALISTLLIIAILTIMVVAFMQSMRVDRLTARSYLSLQKATLAADSGVENARVLIRDTIKNSGGVNFVTWAYSTNISYSSYYVGILPGAIPASTAAGSIGGVNNTVWLVSGPKNAAALSTDPQQVLGLAATNRVNMNWKVQLGTQTVNLIDPAGAPCYAGWVNMVPPAGAKEKTRYAFWVSDESSRIDLGAVGNTNQVTPVGDAYKPLPENLVLKNAGDTTAADPTNYLPAGDLTQKNLAEKRDMVATMTPSSALLYAGTAATPSLIRDQARHTISEKATLPVALSPQDLIPYGPRAGLPKLNLNDVVADAGLTKVAKVQKIHDFIRDSLPEYYKRKNSPPGNVLRIAASIHDYISPDSYPTLALEFEQKLNNSISKVFDFLITRNGTGAPPAATDWNPEWESLRLERRWYGIKRVPMFNAFQFSCSLPTSTGNAIKTRTYSANYTFYLWNMHDRAISIPGQAYIMVWNTMFASLPGSTRVDNLAAVDGLPYNRYEIFAVPGGISLNPREQRAVSLSKSYAVRTTSNNALGAGLRMGFLLFVRDATGGFHVLDGFYTGGSFDPTYSSPGGQLTGNAADGYWDIKDRRQNLGLLNSSWSYANSPTYVNLANYQLLAKWYDQPANTTAGAVDPITHIAQAPMKFIGELGNIFDPVNDIGVAADGNARFANTDAGFNGNQVGRGSKTLNTGQFDIFFDQLQTGNPRNQAIIDSQNWRSYEKYLRYADAALFDIFTVNTAADSSKMRPLNINTPLPRASAATVLDPFATYSSALTSIFPMSGSGYNYAKMTRAAAISDLVRARLTHPTDWTQCRPFRNINDLALLGVTKENITSNANLQLDSVNQNSYFRAKASGSNLVNGALGVQAKLSIQRNPRDTYVLRASNYQRQQVLPRFAEQLSFRSYRYRIHSIGQLYQELVPGKINVISTVKETYLLDLKPRYQSPLPSDPFAPGGQIVYDSTLTKLGNS